MPTAALHSQYWAVQSTAVAPPELAVPGYPMWQASVICGSGFGAMQAAWEWTRDRVAVTTTQEKR